MPTGYTAAINDGIKIEYRERPMLFSAPMVRATLDDSKTQTRRLLNPQPVWVPNWGIAVGGNGAWRIGSPAAMGLSDRGDDWSATFDDETIRRYATAEAYGWGARAGCPYGQPGGRLWVREAWQFYDWTEEGEPCIRFAADNATAWPSTPHGEALVDTWEILSRPENYNIDNHARDRRWRPSIHMPRWASRINLEITGVRVERLQDISYEDALAEGVPHVASSIPHDPSYEETPEQTSRRLCWPQRGYANLWNDINGAGSWDANPWLWVIEFRRLTA